MDFKESDLNPVVSAEIKASNVRQVEEFNWPGWGTSLVASQFQMDKILLIKGLKKNNGAYEGEYLSVSLTKNPPSVRSSEKLAIADLDGDGIDEIIFSSPVTKEVMVLRYPGEKAKPDIEVLAKSEDWEMPMRVLVNDLDHDSHSDLLVFDSSGTSKIHLLKNNGSGHFSEAGSIEFPLELFGKSIWQMASGLDKDGEQYFYAVGAGGHALYRVDPVDPFNSWTVQTLPSEVYDPSFDIVMKDIDGDGWLDVAVTRMTRNDNVLVIYGPLQETFHFAKEKGFLISERTLQGE